MLLHAKHPVPVPLHSLAVSRSDRLPLRLRLQIHPVQHSVPAPDLLFLLCSDHPCRSDQSIYAPPGYKKNQPAALWHRAAVPSVSSIKCQAAYRNISSQYPPVHKPHHQADREMLLSDRRSQQRPHRRSQPLSQFCHPSKHAQDPPYGSHRSSSALHCPLHSPQDPLLQHSGSP